MLRIPTRSIQNVYWIFVLLMIIILTSSFTSYCPEHPKYFFKLIDPYGNTIDVTNETYSEEDTFRISNGSNYTFIFQANSDVEFENIEFSIPVHYTIASTAACSIPSDVSSLVFNTSNPYLHGQRYGLREFINTEDRTGLTTITIIGSTKINRDADEDVYFSFWINLRKGPGPVTERCELRHKIHFIAEG